MYLTEYEYKEITGEDIQGREFLKLLPRAEGALNMITNYFYTEHDLETDNEFRKNQFKLALCSQILHYMESGVSTTAGANQMPSSWSIGRTTINNGGNSITVNGTGDTLIPNEVYTYLSGTGLLYRGVDKRV